MYVPTPHFHSQVSLSEPASGYRNPNLDEQHEINECDQQEAVNIVFFRCP